MVRKIPKQFLKFFSLWYMIVKTLPGVPGSKTAKEIRYETSDESPGFFCGRAGTSSLTWQTTSNTTLKNTHMPVMAKNWQLCFYEPSTRTRLSFEAAMLNLGGICTWFFLVPIPAPLPKARAFLIPSALFPAMQISVPCVIRKRVLPLVASPEFPYSRHQCR